MFPFRDHNPSGRTPFVTYALIVLNVLIFLSYWAELDNARYMNALLTNWAMVPEFISQGYGQAGLLTSIFLHGGVMHLLGNMLFLYIFGDNIEDELGSAKFLGFYLGAGILANLAQYAVAPMSDVPVIGASGAVAGVMGAYLLLYPKARVDIILIFIIFFKIFTLRASIVLGIWIAMQFLGGFGSNPETGGVAYWAHIGGFVAGMAMIYPRWRAKGSRAFWRATEGVPPHPEATYTLTQSGIPKIPRRPRR
jgi:membrane associated rhomboid family serine protease